MSNEPEPRPAPPDDAKGEPDLDALAPPRVDDRPEPAPRDTAPDADTAGRAADGSEGEQPKEWWQDAGMPWKHKPTRADKWCMGWLVFMGMFGLAMLPLRGWLLGLNPPLLVALTGSRSGTAALGALASQGLADHWWIFLLLGSIMSIKFDWIFWWAGKLWGRGMIEVWAGRSERAQRTYARAERWAVKLGWLGMFVAYVPIPLPLMQVIFVLAGASGMSWKRFMVLDFIASTVWLGIYFAFGWSVGEPAVALLKVYAKYANYVAIALIVFVVFTSFRTAGRQAEAKAAPKA